MVEIRRIVACAECWLYWDGNSEPAKCQNDDHSHHVFEKHRHLDLVALPGGAPLMAASFDVAWVRFGYCPKAVETPEQEAFVATFLEPAP